MVPDGGVVPDLEDSHQAAGCGRTIGSWSSLAWDCAGGRTAACGNALRLVAPLTRWHASFAGPPIRGWRWRLRTENLTNEQRVDGSAMLVGPGRSVTVEIGRW